MDVQHLILNPTDVAGTKEDRSIQRQGKTTPARTAGQPFQVVHQCRSACGDGLGHHAIILPARAPQLCDGGDVLVVELLPRPGDTVASQSRGRTGAAAGSPDHTTRPALSASVTASLGLSVLSLTGAVSRRLSVAHRPGAGGGRGGLPPAGLAAPHRAERGALI